MKLWRHKCETPKVRKDLNCRPTVRILFQRCMHLTAGIIKCTNQRVVCFPLYLIRSVLACTEQLADEATSEKATNTAAMASSIKHMISQLAPKLEAAGLQVHRASGERSASSLRKFLPPMPGMPFTPHIPRTKAGEADYPEVRILYGWLMFAGCIGAYSIKKVLLSNKDGAYLNVNLRGDYEHQAEKGLEDFKEARGHTMWWRLAQVKMDEDGANIGVLWDNRTRPHQYSKPGAAGTGAGMSQLVAH